MGFDPPETYRNTTVHALGQYLLNTKAGKEESTPHWRGPSPFHLKKVEGGDRIPRGVGVKEKAQANIHLAASLRARWTTRRLFP
jgi:hypothetical protein